MINYLREAGFVVPNGERLKELMFHKNLNEFKGLSQIDRSLKIMQEAEVQLPDNFILMARVLISIGGLLQQYNVKMNMQELALYLMMNTQK